VADQAQQDSEHLRLLAIFHYVVAALMALWGCFPVFHIAFGAAMVLGWFPTDKAGHEPPAFMGWMFLLMGGAFVAFGWSLATATLVAWRSLARRRRYLFCLVMAGVMAATCMPMGTVLGVFTIVVLMRPTVKQAFGISNGA
jgi:hypothetical protein